MSKLNDEWWTMLREKHANDQWVKASTIIWIEHVCSHQRNACYIEMWYNKLPYNLVDIVKGRRKVRERIMRCIGYKIFAPIINSKCCDHQMFLEWNSTIKYLALTKNLNHMLAKKCFKKKIPHLKVQLLWLHKLYILIL